MVSISAGVDEDHNTSLDAEIRKNKKKLINIYDHIQLTKDFN